MKKVLFVIVLCMFMIPEGYSQGGIDLLQIIGKELILAKRYDSLKEYRNTLLPLQRFPINDKHDTIFVIEEIIYSNGTEYVSLSCWTDSIIVSATGSKLSDTTLMKIKKERFFPQWLIDKVEAWDTDTLMALDIPEKMRYEDYSRYYVYRITIIDGIVEVSTLNFTSKQSSFFPMNEEERNLLWEIWIDNDMDWEDMEDVEDED
ncbi:MAG: hypothetical protein II670_02230 [Alphaproteobacteria bacterium]|jgi:hypothetical protein|nr:hypothetical protein [Alphaproteobacteria bacterium]